MRWCIGVRTKDDLNMIELTSSDMPRPGDKITYTSLLMATLSINGDDAWLMLR